jgi:hypothetical protein
VAPDREECQTETTRKMRSTPLRLVALASTILVASSCADTGPTVPPSPVADANLLATAATTDVNGLLRRTPLAESITVTQAIGSAGGVISIPAAGFTVTVPRGAVLSTTTFSVTAPAGRVVAYVFGPHGATFNVPLVVTQDLSNTIRDGLLPQSFFAAYFRSIDDVNLEDGAAAVSEILDSVVLPAPGMLSFSIRHFSGYMVATGRSGGDGR